MSYPSSAKEEFDDLADFWDVLMGIKDQSHELVRVVAEFRSFYPAPHENNPAIPDVELKFKAPKEQ